MPTCPIFHEKGKIERRTVQCRTIAQSVNIGWISHNAGFIFPSMRPQSHRSSTPIINSCNLSNKSSHPYHATNLWQFLRMAFQRLFLLKDISKASHSALSSWLTFSMAESWMLELGDVMEACVDAVARRLTMATAIPRTAPDGSYTPQCPHHQHQHPSSTRQNVSISCGTVLPCVKIFCWRPLQPCPKPQ